jgi:glycosyltransferase involved in cell wall biosynthesis
MGGAGEPPGASAVNLLFLDQFSDLGGAQQCLVDLIPAVQAAGWNTTCAAPGSGRLFEKLRERGVTAHVLPEIPLNAGSKPLGDFVRFACQAPRLAHHISRLARESRADVIYVNGPRVLPAAAWVARRTGLPLIFHCHNHLAQRAAVTLAGRSLEFANARVIACCQHVARPLWPYLDPGRLRVIYNGVGPVASVRAARAGVPRIGVIGRVSPEKGQMEFVRAARLVAKARPECQFVICGAPLFAHRDAELYFDKVRKAAKGLPVEFTGWQENVSAVLAGVNLLVVPSLREPGAPRVILEAYAARVPVVAFVSGGIPEILHDGETGFLVEPPTPEALAARLQELLSSPERLAEIADSAYEIWKEEFTVERYQREVLEAIGLTQTRSATGRSI